MRKIKIFISSVQNEFVRERQVLYEFLLTDALLGKFFDPFIFESLPASGQQVDKVYLDEVARCDIYIGLFGKSYGFIDAAGISPTEREFDEASKHSKTRLIFLTNHQSGERDIKENLLIKKAEQEVVRKMFGSEIELKSGVYVSLIKYLEDKEFIRTGPFDASICRSATLDDLDNEKIAEFVRIAKTKRGFPLSDQSAPEKILTHLNLMLDNGITNAAILLFGKQPQRFFICSEVKCAQFHGTEVAKPIPAYQVYKGDVFQLVNQAVDFVISRINVRVGTRNESTQVSLEYEIPRAVITEAIVNAIAHRDYTSNGSVQVMLFRNRLEIWNPGQLPYNLTLAKLKKPHSSFPANPLIAEPLYLTGFIERLGTGIPDMLELSKNAGLKEPEFSQDMDFKAVVWRFEEPTGEPTGEVTGEVTGEPMAEIVEEVKRVLIVLIGEMKRIDIQNALELRHQENFRDNYLIPSLEGNYIEMIYPETPNHPNQRYRLTEKGLEIQKTLNKARRKRRS
jgi:ATP-dependent DNA helicase RecG